MKHFKIIIGLLFLTALIVSCEKETIDPIENSELNNQPMSIDKVPGTISFLGDQYKSVQTKQGTKQPLMQVDFPQTSNNLNTDFITFGTGDLRDVGTGTIDLTGIVGSVKEAHIYWHGLKSSTSGTASLNVNGTVVNVENLGYSGTNCWGEGVSQSLKADITPIVASTLNGSYELKDFGDLNPNGASIVVFFDDGDNSNNRDVTLLGGNDSNVDFSGIPGDPTAQPDYAGWDVTFPEFNYSSGSANLQLHVADGQEFNDGEIILNSELLIPSGSIFEGEIGTYWDIELFDISAFLTPGPNSLSLNSPPNGDCLSLVLAIVDVPSQVVDSDNDGILDDEDNCPEDANADQADNDIDGIGDVCDNDDDNDSILDIDDNCPFISNTNQGDFDGDGLGDVCDEDIDGDGCGNDDDPNDNSNIEAIVDIDGCDSGVDNRVTSDCGYTISDMIDDLEAGTYKNHGAFVRAVAHLTKSWVAEGLISQFEKDAIMTCAGGASIP